jgi:hypothetical protein
MSNLTNRGRQWPLVLEQVIDYTDFNGVTTTSDVQPELPQGAVVLSGGIFVETAFGAGAAADVGVSGTGALYLNDVDLNSLGYTAIATTGLGLKASGETILFTPDTEAKAATAGKARLILTYVIAGRSNEVQ